MEVIKVKGIHTTTTTNSGAAISMPGREITFQGTVTGTGAVTATVICEGTNDGVNYLPIATVTLSGTTTASDGVWVGAPWAMIRSRVSAISGTGATVTSNVAYFQED